MNLSLLIFIGIIALVSFALQDTISRYIEQKYQWKTAKVIAALIAMILGLFLLWAVDLIGKMFGWL